MTRSVMNAYCQCEQEGYCPRHKMMKTGRFFELCKGTADTSDCGYKYWEMWEQGGFGATAPADPHLEPWEWCEGKTPKSTAAVKVIKKPAEPDDGSGLGTNIKRMLSSIGVTPERYVEVKKMFGLPPTCNCKAREAWLNRVGKHFGIT